MELVQKGLMEATCIYPTRGLQLMKLATNILDGKKYNKENILTSTIVDRNNVDIHLTQNIEQQRLKPWGHKQTHHRQKVHSLSVAVPFSSKTFTMPTST